ncbi:hypothetical protein Trydic_g2269 [Trypoxylus dichotomus]
MAEIQNRDRLKIDSVLSTQSELGPSIPDGGYGWVIVLTTMFFQLLVPSLIVGYGILVVNIRLENNGSVYPTLWDNPIVYTPLLFIATWTFIDPWIRKLIETTKGSRTAPWFLVSGILSGAGASLIISQCEVIIAQYFKVHLRKVNVIIQFTVAIGFIVTPIVLGRNMFIHGLLTPIIWHQILILQGLIVAMFIKKPPYLKTTENSYKLIQGTNDDEIDIYPNANTKELQHPRQSATEENIHMGIPTTSDQAGLSLADELAASALREEEFRIRAEKRSSSMINIEVHASENGKPSWVKFEDDNQNEESKPTSRKNLQTAYYSRSSQDLDRIDTFEDSFVHIPKPLFTETHINNNNTYSFDGGESVTSEEPVVFMPVAHKQPGFCEKHLFFFKQPTFYKSLLQIITLKYSIFMFYALFPSYIYMKIQSLRILELCTLVGLINLVHLAFVAITIVVENSHRRRAIFLWISSWNGAIGFILITDVRSEAWFVVGAIQIALSIQSLQYFGTPLLKLSRRGESNAVYLALSSIAGLSFFIFFAIDITYVNCFRMMAFFQFIMGGIWFANFTFKKVKHLLIARG